MRLQASRRRSLRNTLLGLANGLSLVFLASLVVAYGSETAIPIGSADGFFLVATAWMRSPGSTLPMALGYLGVFVVIASPVWFFLVRPVLGDAFGLGSSAEGTPVADGNGERAEDGGDEDSGRVERDDEGVDEDSERVERDDDGDEDSGRVERDDDGDEDSERVERDDEGVDEESEGTESDEEEDIEDVADDGDGDPERQGDGDTESDRTTTDEDETGFVWGGASTTEETESDRNTSGDDTEFVWKDSSES